MDEANPGAGSVASPPRFPRSPGGAGASRGKAAGSCSEGSLRLTGSVPTSARIGKGKAPLLFDRTAICIGILVIATILSWIPRYRGPIDLRWDAGTYYVLGTSLAQGEGYRLLYEPGKIEAIQYPPGLPMIVAAHEIALGSTDPRVVGPCLRRTWMAFSLVSVILCFLFARRFLGAGYSLAVALGFLFCYEVFFLSTLCFAELPFALVTLLFFLTYRREDGVAGETTCGVLAICAYLLRTIGIALLMAWVVDAALRRRMGTAAIRAVVALIPVAAWLGYIHAVENSPSYRHPAYSYQRDPSMFYNVSYATNVALRDPFIPELGRAHISDIAARFGRNLVRLPYYIGQVLVTPAPLVRLYLEETSWGTRPVNMLMRVAQAALYLFGCAALIGIALQLGSKRFLIAFYVAMTLGAVCLTPWPGQMLRYLCPIFPFLAIALFEAAGRLGRLPGPRTAMMAISAVAILGGALWCFTASDHRLLNSAKFETPRGETASYRLMHFPPDVASVWDALHWLRANAPRNSVVAASMPAWAYLETGLRTIMPPFFLDLPTIERALESARPDYLLLDDVVMERNYNQRFATLVTSFPNQWRLVYAAPKARVYKHVNKPE